MLERKILTYEKSKFEILSILFFVYRYRIELSSRRMSITTVLAVLGAMSSQLAG